MYTIYGFAYFMLVVVGVGKKPKLEEEELLYTGTQEIPTLKSAQKSPGSYKFGHTIFLSNENVARPCYREQSYKRACRYSVQSCCVWYLIQIMNLVLQYLLWYSVKVDPPYYCCALSIC